MAHEATLQHGLANAEMDRMFIFHWLPDCTFRVLYSGSMATAYLGSDVWSKEPDSIEDIFQKVLFTGLKRAYASGQYYDGHHELSAADLGAGVSLVFDAMHTRNEGTFWYGHILLADADNRSVEWTITPNALPKESNASLRWLALADGSSDFIWFKDIKGRYLYTNRTFDAFYGLEPGEAVGKYEAELFGEERARHNEAEDIRAIQSGKRTQSSEMTQATNSRELITLEISRHPILGADGEVQGLFCAGRDLTRHRRRERELSREIGLLKALLDNSGVKIAYYSTSGELIYANRRIREEFALKAEHFSLINVLTGKMFGSRNADFREAFVEALEKQQSVETICEFLTPGGSWVRDKIVFVPYFNDEGTVDGLLTIGNENVEDMQRHTADEFERAAVDQLGYQFETLLRATDDAVWVKDRRGRFVAANEGFHKLTGILSLEALGRSTIAPRNELPPEITGPDKLEELAVSGPVKVQERVRYAEDDVFRFIEITLNPVRNRSDEFIGFVGIARDISDSKKLAQELVLARKSLSDAAFVDSLTGLPNERHARDQIAALLPATDQNSAEADAILLINIDRFGGINDSLGYAAGDVLLQQLAERIKKAARRAYVSRFGGDEFLVHTHGKSRAEVERLATDILESVQKPFYNEGRYLTVSASIGITLLPETTNNVDDALTQAGLALRESRRGRVNSFHIFDTDLMQAARDRFTLEADIRVGLEKGQFEAHYQPKIDLATNEVTGAEALLRWRHPRRGNIPPAMFVPLAEETGLILPLGRKVLFDACVFAREWNERSEQTMKVAVNLSPRQLMSENFIPMLRQTLEDTACRAEWLELEITENLLLSDQYRVEQLLDELCELGLNIAIDDFGTGYSALAYLINYPISTLKVDRSFVRDVITDKKKAVLVKAILDMANGLGMNTVAEGIETAAEAAWVSKAGCREGQGFLWCKAIPKGAFLQWTEVHTEEKAAE